MDPAGIETNCNTVPFDPNPPFKPSGVRIGTPAVTSRGMKEPEMQKLGDWMARTIENVGNEQELAKIAAEVKELCKDFPCPGIDPSNWN